MVRKFILTSAVIFFNEGSSMQVAAAVLVSIFFLVLHVCYLPFANSSDNWLQGLALVGLVFVYFIGLLIQVSYPLVIYRLSRLMCTPLVAGPDKHPRGCFF